MLSTPAAAVNAEERGNRRVKGVQKPMKAILMALRNQIDGKGFSISVSCPPAHQMGPGPGCRHGWLQENDPLLSLGV
jgi:hypothetical protein